MQFGQTGKLMKLIKLLLSVFLIMTFTGCDRLNLSTGGAGVAVVDLTALSEATGEDQVIKTKMEIATTDLNAQLTEAAAQLEKQVAEKKEAFGNNATPEQKQELQQLVLQAGQQLKQNQALAQQKAQQYKAGLLESWREEIQPVLEEVAAKHNAKTVIAVNPALMWFDTSIDITADVIDALRDQQAGDTSAEKAPDEEASKSE
jgi:Skp family chaperone for outer membrane proteins